MIVLPTPLLYVRACVCPEEKGRQESNRSMVGAEQLVSIMTDSRTDYHRNYSRVRVVYGRKVCS